MTPYLIVGTWLLLGAYSIWLWRKAFGGFDRKYGLSPLVCFMAFFCAPLTAIGWTVGYLQIKHERKERNND